VEQFVADHPYGLMTEFDANADALIIRAHALQADSAIPLRFGAIAGDVLYNLRCALNYLAVQLARIGTGPGRDTQFPLFFDPPGSSRKLDAAARYKDATNRFLHGVAATDRTSVEQMQPYNGGQWAHLAIIGTFGDYDRHQMINASAWLAEFKPPSVRGPVAKLSIEHTGFMVVSEGAELMRVIELETAGEGEVAMELPLSYTVAFGEINAKPAFTVADLRQAIDLAESVIDSFRLRFS
jgi:hypothetical protein